MKRDRPHVRDSGVCEGRTALFVRVDCYSARRAMPATKSGARKKKDRAKVRGARGIECLTGVIFHHVLVVSIGSGEVHRGSSRSDGRRNPGSCGNPGARCCRRADLYINVRPKDLLTRDQDLLHASKSGSLLRGNGRSMATRHNDCHQERLCAERRVAPADTRSAVASSC